MKNQTAPIDFYTQWMEGQTALLKTWSNAAAQTASALAEGNLSEAMKKSTEGYSTIVQHQQEQAKNLFSETANFGKTMKFSLPTSIPSMDGSHFVKTRQFLHYLPTK